MRHLRYLPMLLGACTPFFDSNPSGELVEDSGADTAIDAAPEVVDDVYQIEGGWQCGPFELLDPPDLNEACTPTGTECREGECIVFGDGAVCTNYCSPFHCPEMCGPRATCAAAGAEFSDGTPQGLCTPGVGDFALCTFDDQCASDFCFNAFPVDGVRDFGWCLPTCEDSCEPVDNFESFCVPLSEDNPATPNVCFVACDPNAEEFGQCPADLHCVPVDDTQGFCAVYPSWLRAMIGDRRD